jgi:hypothetical protein
VLRARNAGFGVMCLRAPQADERCSRQALFGCICKSLRSCWPGHRCFNWEIAQAPSERCWASNLNSKTLGGPSTTLFQSQMRIASNGLRIPCLLIVALAIAGLLAPDASAQAPAVAANPVGVWRGTSLCRLRPSACNDEVVVYRITRVKTSDSLSVDARKIVNGQEEQMGIIGCRLATSGAQFTCSMPNGVWRFAIRGDSLVGELRLPDNRKYRDVSTARWH